MIGLSSQPRPNERSPGGYRVGIDIGGTFTDFVLIKGSSDKILLHKSLTTPVDPSAGALHGLSELLRKGGLALAEIGEIVHGTTLVTNAVIERRGAPIGLITTKGMRDIIEIGKEQSYDIFNLQMKFPAPLVPRSLRLEVPERLSRDGSVITPLDADAVRSAARELAAAGAEAIAICFLHSYMNDAHEQQAAQIVRETCPEMFVSTSADVVGEIREYPRFTTTCANAYVQPIIDRYLAKFEGQLAARGFRGKLHLMHSAGGLISVDSARRFPIRLLESGPAGGGLATAFFGRLAGKRDVISFDMGGTTAKTCLVEDGRCEIAPMLEAGRVDRFKKGSGLPILSPVIDMIEIGAGGGSIAEIDSVGLLSVGSRSASSTPGPACYDRGGTQPTVTDANLLLGYYDPGFFLGGEMALNRGAAEVAMRTVADPLKLSVIEAARGIHSIVVERMAAAARVHMVEKGKDPRSYSMIGFGGAGPAHVAEIARILGIREVIIPPASGAVSALGFLAGPLSFERVASRPMLIDDKLDYGPLSEILAKLEAEARALVHKAGVSDTEMTVDHTADMRLVGQMHEIRVQLPPPPYGSDWLKRLREAFVRNYEARYKAVFEGAAIEAVSFRVRCTGPEPALSVRQPSGRDEAGALKGYRQAYFGESPVETPVYDRNRLVLGQRVSGPAIIEERESTTILPPGDTLQVDDAGNLRIAIGSQRMPTTLIARDMDQAKAVELIESDPVSLEIMWGRLVTITEEMWLTVSRTAFSMTISDSHDFSCDLLDASGENLAQSPRAMPSFSGSMPLAVKTILAKYPADTLRPGDVLITNDPWVCTGHAFDVAIATPIFHDGRVVAIATSIAHVTDIGGVKDAERAHEAYDEGVRVPPMKLYTAGRRNEDLFTLLRENIRNPDQIFGDLHALMTANQLGAARLVEFMNEYGMEDLSPLAFVVQARSERAMREAIRALPDGTWNTEIKTNPLGSVLTFPLALTKENDRIVLDFAGAPPEATYGGINCVMNLTRAYAIYPLKSVLTPDVRGNAGCYRAFQVKAPEGSMLNCLKPSSVSVRQRTGWYVAANTLRALSLVAPTRTRAFSGMPCIHDWYVKEPSGRIVRELFLTGGGQGASAGSDGKSGLIWPTSASNTSVEIFESMMPVIVLEKQFKADSGGVGEYRGGLGIFERFRRLANDATEIHVSIRPDGVGLPQGGINAGITPSAYLYNERTGERTDCASVAVRLTSTDDVLEVQLAGGTGVGDPARRLKGAIETDQRDGRVSNEVTHPQKSASVFKPLRRER